MKDRKWLIALAVLMISALALAACRPAAPATPSPEEMALQVAGTQAARATQASVSTLVARVTELSVPTAIPQPTATPMVCPTCPPPPTAAPAAAGPTAAPAAQPAAPGAATGGQVWASDGKCYFQIEYMGDVNVPPDTVMKPSQEFEKIWRVKNTGTCTWDSADVYGVDLVLSGGDKMGAHGVADVRGPVAPGDVVEVAVDLVAPAEEGTYTAYWVLTGPNNTRFGYGDNNQYALAVRISVVK